MRESAPTGTPTGRHTGVSWYSQVLGQTDMSAVQFAPAAAEKRRRRGDHPVRSGIVPGGVFPDYALPDHTGTVRTLSEVQGRDPLILTLARGNYCPKEHQQHLELAANYPKIAAAYTRSPPSPPTTITPRRSSAHRWAPSGRTLPTAPSATQRRSC